MEASIFSLSEAASSERGRQKERGPGGKYGKEGLEEGWVREQERETEVEVQTSAL